VSTTFSIAMAITAINDQNVRQRLNLLHRLEYVASTERDRPQYQDQPIFSGSRFQLSIRARPGDLGLSEDEALRTNLRHGLRKYFSNPDNRPSAIADAARRLEIDGLDDGELRDRVLTAAPSAELRARTARLAGKPRALAAAAAKLIQESWAELAIDAALYERSATPGAPSVAEIFSTQPGDPDSDTHLLDRLIETYADVAHLHRFLPVDELLATPPSRITLRDRDLPEMIMAARLSPRFESRSQLRELYADPRNRPPYIAELLSRASSREPSQGRRYGVAPEGFLRSCHERARNETTPNWAVDERSRVIGDLTLALEIFDDEIRNRPGAAAEFLRSYIVEERDARSEDEEYVVRTFDAAVASLEHLEHWLPVPVERESGLVL
jgi:hypothetical protein